MKFSGGALQSLRRFDSHSLSQQSPLDFRATARYSLGRGGHFVSRIFSVRKLPMPHPDFYSHEFQDAVTADLFQQLRKLLDSEPTVRDFAVLDWGDNRHDESIYVTAKYNDVSGLLFRLRHLAGVGYVVETTEPGGRIPRFQMSEGFVDDLRYAPQLSNSP